MSTLFAVAPALPLHAAGKYVAGAYIVFILVLIIYLGIMGVRLTRNQREIVELRRQLEARESVEAPASGHPHASENDNESHSHLASVEKGVSTDGAEVA
jgi:hypothetical protein